MLRMFDFIEVLYVGSSLLPQKWNLWEIGYWSMIFLLQLAPHQDGAREASKGTVGCTSK